MNRLALNNIFDFPEDFNKEPLDYISPEDNLLYCGKCHTHKQIKLETLEFGIQILPVSCQCQAEKYERKLKEEERQKQFERINRLKNNGMNDPVLRQWTFQNDNKENPIMNKARKYVSSFKDIIMQIEFLCEI